MGYLVYTPSRSLIGGSDGKLHPELQQFSDKHKDPGKETSSLDGTNLETTYLGRVEYYDVKSDLVDFADWAKWNEFNHSVAGGEPFSIDGYGTEGSPDNLLSVKMVRNSWKYTEPGPRHRVFSFKVRVL